MAYDVAVVLAYSAISFTMGYIAMKIDRQEHGVLQVFFLMLSLYGVLSVIGSVSVILQVESITQFDPMVNSTLVVWQWATIFVLGYIFIMFIWNIIQMLIGYIDRKKKERLGTGTYTGVARG